MNSKCSLLISSIGLCMFSTQSFAQVENETKAYAGFEYAWVKFKDQTSVASVLVSTVGGSAASTQDTGISIGRFYGGYSFTENLGVEVGYINSGSANATFSGVARNGVAYSGSSSYEVSGFDYAAVIRPNKASGLNGLFLKIGGHSLDGKSSANVTSGVGSGVSSVTVSGSGTLYGLGYEVDVSPNISSRFSFTNYNKLAGVSGSKANVYSVGLAFKF